MQFDISQDELRSFSMGFFRFSFLEGPMQLVRFSHSGRGKKGKLGRFWMHAHDISMLLSQPGTGLDLIARVSDQWAICDDWGDKGLMWVMRIPAKVRIPAAIGKAHFQPTISQKTRKLQDDLGAWNMGRNTVYWLPSDASYAGSGLQYIVPVETTDGHTNDGIVNLIGPKLATRTVATNPKLFLAGR